MLKKTITYENPFTNEQVSEEHYFHISKADLVEMEMEEHNVTYVKDGETLTGMQAKLQRIVDSQDGKAIMQEIKDIIRRSYGKKEGDRFIKTQAIWDDFASTEAYSQLFFELCTNAEEAAGFMTGVIPGNLEQISAEIRTQAEKAALTNGDVKSEEDIQVETEPRTLSEAEVVAMDSAELKSGLAEGRYKLS